MSGKTVPDNDKWTFETDNTFETIEDWLELFESILAVQGFTDCRLELANDYDEGEYNDGEYSDETGV